MLYFTCSVVLFKLFFAWLYLPHLCLYHMKKNSTNQQLFAVSQSDFGVGGTTIHLNNTFHVIRFNVPIKK